LSIIFKNIKNIVDKEGISLYDIRVAAVIVSAIQKI
jgi:hypothetical protein